jgi:hypothetical protein
MQFLAKFFPESIVEELTSAPLRRLLWLQIRHGIVADEIYCPPELCVLFAAQSVCCLRVEPYRHQISSAPSVHTVRRRCHCVIDFDGFCQHVATSPPRRPQPCQSRCRLCGPKERAASSVSTNALLFDRDFEFLEDVRSIYSQQPSVC